MKFSTSLFVGLAIALPAFGQQTNLKVVQDTVKVINAGLRVGKLSNNASEDSVLSTDQYGNLKLKRLTVNPKAILLDSVVRAPYVLDVTTNTLSCPTCVAIYSDNAFAIKTKAANNLAGLYVTQYNEYPGSGGARGYNQRQMYLYLKDSAGNNMLSFDMFGLKVGGTRQWVSNSTTVEPSNFAVNGYSCIGCTNGVQSPGNAYVNGNAQLFVLAGAAGLGNQKGLVSALRGQLSWAHYTNSPNAVVAGITGAVMPTGGFNGQATHAGIIGLLGVAANPTSGLETPTNRYGWYSNNKFSYGVEGYVHAPNDTTQLGYMLHASAINRDALYLGDNNIADYDHVWRELGGVLIDSIPSRYLMDTIPYPFGVKQMGSNARNYLGGYTAIGALGTRVKRYTTSSTIDNLVHTVEIDATASDITITLPPAATYFGYSQYTNINDAVGIEYKFVRIDNSANIVTIKAAGVETINGSNTYAGLSARWSTCFMQTDGSQWLTNSSSVYTSSSFENPSGAIGLSAVNGTANTFMRSDATPALSQSIKPLWTSAHTFSNYVNLLTGARFTTYNTTDTSSNYDRIIAAWNSNVYEIGSYYGGVGGSGNSIVRSMRLGVNATPGASDLSTSSRTFTINSTPTVSQGVFDFSPSTTSIAGSIFTLRGAGTVSSGTQNWFTIQPTFNVTGSPTLNTLLIQPWFQAGGGGSNYLINAGTQSAADGGGTFTQRFFITSAGIGNISSRFAVGNPSATASLQVSSNNSTNANYGTTGLGFVIDAATYTSSSSSGTIAVAAANSVGVPTLAASNSTTITDAATLYIANAPSVGTNISLTNKWALYVNGGTTMLGGGLSTAKTTTTSNAYLTSGDGVVANSGASGNLFGGATVVNFRSRFGGVTTGGLNSNASYANTIFSISPLTTAGTGTHSVLANVAINPVGTINSSGATINETSSLYVNGAATGGTSNYGLHVAGASANNKIDGYLSVQHISGNSAAPTITANSGAGASPTIAISGTDLGFRVTLTAGTSPSQGADLFTVTFSSAYISNPHVMKEAINANAAVLASSSYSTTTTTTYTLTTVSGAGLVAGQQYVWDIALIQ